MARKKISLYNLHQEITDSVYTTEKYPFIIDPTGQAGQYLKYRARVLSVFKKGDFELESLRKGLTQALHNGGWLVLDFQQLPCDLSPLFDKDHFPEVVLSPHEVFLEESYAPLLRPADEFAARIIYEHQDALAQGAFQDRTKAHAPERVACVDKKFEPKDAFRFIVTVQGETVPEELAGKMNVLCVECSEKQIQEKAGMWGGDVRPREEKSREQMKLDTDLLEHAFDGECDVVQQLLGKQADPLAVDGRGNISLSEAAVQGHLEVVRCLLDWQPPLGSNPNHQGDKKRTPLHRAAFQGHVACVQLLLERGGDPRLKTLDGERPYDMANDAAVHAALEGWDVAVTDRLKAERDVAQEAADEKLVQSVEDRKLLERRRKMQKLAELIEAGEKDLLEIEVMDMSKTALDGCRDDRGNNALHVAAVHDRLECAVWLIDEKGLDVNARESKGWTPIAIAGFHGHKKLAIALMERKADPEVPNAYRKNAFDVANSDEIRDAMKAVLDKPTGEPSAAASSSSPKRASPEPAAAKPKGKARAKSKAKAKEPGAASSAKAKVRPKSKSRA